MKAQKCLAVLATVSLLGLTAACNSSGTKSDRYEEGFQAGKQQGYSEGYDVGYDDGYADGDDAGYARAADYFRSVDYTAAFNEGHAVGLAKGYADGYKVGTTDGYDLGYDDGYSDGYDDGYDAGELVSYDIGYSDGYADGETFGYDLGYDDGFDDGEVYGYDIGYDDGWADAEAFHGLSVGKSKQLQGYANLLSMAHNDLFDYSKIPAPKQTKRGLVANGKLLLSETSLTNKDTLKRAAAVEQYLVVEMAKQVKAKFGLSNERSIKVAKASNHFRKFSSSRALTAEDTNAYASEILGSDFKAIEKAYEASAKGNFSDLSGLIEKAAVKNEVSPEKMGQIINNFFM